MSFLYDLPPSLRGRTCAARQCRGAIPHSTGRRLLRRKEHPPHNDISADIIVVLTSNVK